MLLNFALQYLAKGWSIVPVPKGAKSPYIKWKQFQTRLPTEAEVREWWTETPDANIGIVTGSLSGICTIDVDGPEGRESAKALNLPPTLTVKTGREDGGHQYWYKHPGVPVRTTASEVAPHVDTRGDGGIAIIPYSTHKTGKLYAWMGGIEALNGVIAPFPQNVLGMLGSPKEQRTGFTDVSTQEPWVTELLKGVPDGEKHKACIRLAAYFSSKGLPCDVTKLLLLDWNTRNATPAEPEGIVERVEDVYKRYANGNAGGAKSSSQPADRHSQSIVRPKDAYANFKEELKKGAKTIATGFPSLDRYSRGLLIGNLSVIGAWPGVGKTAFTLGLARMLAEAGNRVLYFPTEMAVNELMRVFVSSGLSIPFQRVMDGDLSDEEHAKAAEYLEGAALANLHIEPITSPTLQDVENAVKQCKPNVFMLDYLQHTTGSTGGKRTDISELVMGLKDIAKRYECAGVVTSQFHRPYKSNDGELVPPTLFDFAECGQIEREVSLALLMYPVEKERFSESMEFPVNFILAKNRFGKVCEFQLKFNQQHVRFSE
jgi:archaellum biogenesis ATPase FlaH